MGGWTGGCVRKGKIAGVKSVSPASVRPAAGQVSASASANNPQIRMPTTNPLAQPSGFGLRRTHPVSGFSRDTPAATAASLGPHRGHRAVAEPPD